MLRGNGRMTPPNEQKEAPQVLMYAGWIDSSACRADWYRPPENRPYLEFIRGFSRSGRSSWMVLQTSSCCTSS